jgi:hypothetical protein
MEPYACEYKAHCWKAIPEVSLFNMQQLPLKTKLGLYELGKVNLEEIPRELLTKPVQLKQLEVYTAKNRIVEKEPLSTFLQKLEKPLAFLDFETYQLPLPKFQNSRPYEPIPFAFSLHTLVDDVLDQKAYIAQSIHEDARNTMAELLTKTISDEMIIVAYNAPFERQILRKLALDVPTYQEALEDIASRVVDLMEPFAKGWVVDSAMRGKHSLKMVLPALLPELSYDDLEIGDGGFAMNSFILLDEEQDESKQEAKRVALLEYCGLDTYALVRIYQLLKTFI